MAEGGAKRGGRILRVTRDGSRETLAESLPSFGDHHSNAPVVGAADFTGGDVSYFDLKINAGAPYVSFMDLAHGKKTA